MTIITLWIKGKEKQFTNVDSIIINNGIAVWEAYNKLKDDNKLMGDL